MQRKEIERKLRTLRKIQDAAYFAYEFDGGRASIEIAPIVMLITLCILSCIPPKHGVADLLVALGAIAVVLLGSFTLERLAGNAAEMNIRELDKRLTRYQPCDETAFKELKQKAGTFRGMSGKDLKAWVSKERKALRSLKVEDADSNFARQEA